MQKIIRKQPKPSKNAFIQTKVFFWLVVARKQSQVNHSKYTFMYNYVFLKKGP